MKIGVVLYGFLNKIDNLNNLNRIFELCNNIDLELSIYYSIKTKISELYTPTMTLNDEMIQSKLTNDYIFNYELIDYDPYKYIKYCDDIGMPMITSQRLYPYRILSMFDSVKSSLELVKDNLDFMILTRIDKLNDISNIPIMQIKKTDNLYLWRTSPYKKYGEAEDRIMYGNQIIISKLTDLYDEMKNYVFDDDTFYIEKIIGDFLIKRFNNNLLYQDDLNITTNINELKYSNEMKEEVLRLFKLYKLTQ